MNSFIIALNAVIPFMVYISFGYLVQKIGWADDTLLKRMNQMVFKAFFPIMMFYNIYQKDRNQGIEPVLVLVALISLAVVVLISLVIVPRLVEDRKRRGVVIQAIYRSNFVLFAVPLMNNVYGEAGSALATMLVAIVVPIYNIIAVIVLEYYGKGGGQTSLIHLLKNVLKNPLIMGTVVGFIFYILRIPIAPCIEKPIAQFAALSTPLALFILGGTLKFGSMLRNLPCILLTLCVKLAILPGIMIAVCLLVGLSPVERFLIFCMYGTPVAASSYAMAQNMGCDGDLAGEYVVLSTTLSVITIFLWVFFLNQMGLI